MSPAGTGGELPPLEVSGRLDRLRALFAGAGEEGGALGGLLVTAPANIRWLSGFSGSAGLLLVTGDGALLTTDGRYRTQSSEQLRAAGALEDIAVCIGGAGEQRDAVVARAKGTSSLGLEGDSLSWSAQRRWAEALAPVALVCTSGLVEGLRVVKDLSEIARMERAAAIADRALESSLPLLSASGKSSAKQQVTESDFAAALDHAMRVLGAEDRAFETIVASGENSAKPHARPSDRVIRAGDPVVVDFGAIFDGYRSDMTRTFCIGGEPTGELASVFEVVAASQRAGVEAVGPGVTSGSVDEVCRKIIGEAGWADRFEHGTGHGVGLDIHEGPSVGPGSTAILTAGTVVTVEPGVYLPGAGGVRIEDTLVVTLGGSRALTLFPKEVAV
jgi:Xaa-Pro aminopeptidase